MPGLICASMAFASTAFSGLLILELRKEYAEKRF